MVETARKRFHSIVHSNSSSVGSSRADFTAGTTPAHLSGEDEGWGGGLQGERRLENEVQWRHVVQKNKIHLLRAGNIHTVSSDALTVIPKLQ